MNCACAGRSSRLAKFCRIFQDWPAKKGWRLQLAEAAMAVNEATWVAKKRFLTWNIAKESGLKIFNVLSSKTIIYFSRDLQRNLKQDVNVLVTAISRHVRYLLNIGEGKSCFSLPDDLTVKDYFCQWVIFMIIFMTLARRQAKDESEAKVRQCLLCFSGVLRKLRPSKT